MRIDLRKGELFRILVFSALFVLPACGSGAPDNSGNSHDYTVGGTISNLLVEGLVIQNNGCDDLIISANSTSFTFPTAIADGERYDVTVKNQPETQFCTVTQASGTVSGANVENVDIQCSFQREVIVTRE